MRISSGLRSCTDMVEVTHPFELDGRRITLIDTPGFDDTTKSDTDILRMITLYLASSYVFQVLLSMMKTSYFTPSDMSMAKSLLV